MHKNPYSPPEAQVLNEYTPSEIRDYASFWQRFFASFLDGIITGLIGGVFGFVFGWIAGSAGMSIEHIELVGNLIGFVIGWLYGALLESSSKQATWGKQAMKLRVTDMEGNRISFGRATGRHFGKIVSSVILLIGYFMMLWTERKQTLHDVMAGCLVYKTEG